MPARTRRRASGRLKSGESIRTAASALSRIASATRVLMSRRAKRTFSKASTRPTTARAFWGARGRAAAGRVRGGVARPEEKPRRRREQDDGAESGAASPLSEERVPRSRKGRREEDEEGGPSPPLRHEARA